MAALRDMSTTKQLAILVVLLLAVFLIGFLPQWSRARSLEETVSETRLELSLHELGGRLGAALAESQRGNYERARQLMTGFYSQLQDRIPQIGDPAQRQMLTGLLEQRDEIITLLSRAEPESTSRLNMMYSNYFAAVHPVGRATPEAVTGASP
ncbi:MAG: hypothetical protein WD737_13820 [Gemmatimonadota bacterium]